MSEEFNITIDSSSDDDIEETIRVLWMRTMKMHHVSICTNQSLQKVFDEIADIYKIPSDLVQITYKDAPISPFDSLESLGFRIVHDSLYACKLAAPIKPVPVSMTGPGENRLHVKCLTKDKKKPLDYYLLPHQTFKDLFSQCAKDMDIAVDRITIKFDGDNVSPKDTPKILDLEETHDHVLKVVELADKLGLVIIPYGGGTSVSGAVTCPNWEPRSIVSLDTSQMNKIFWVDQKNLLINCQCGIVGQDLENYLQPKGFTVGHEPDSYEFSTVGGWVATRASGMKKNIYGNIEDLLVSVKMVTPRGVLHRSSLTPRQSVGPDFNHVILGSEGTLGVVTEVVLKIRPVAEVRKYGSVVFPTFSDGVNCMREVAKQRCQPASIRLMDNEQFVFGQTLKPSGSYFRSLSEAFKKAYLTNVKGFDLSMICVATLLFEGSKKSVEQQEAKIYEIVSKFNGMPAGEKNGERGYMLTFVIAYIRDIGLEFNVVAESFETSVPWANTLNLCRNVKYVINKECRKHKVKRHFISHRVTQTYDSGCCVYFYFAFNWEGLDDPIGTYETIEAAAREEILANGGSLSHHHGVGKLRSRWYRSQVSELGETLYRHAKHILDPNNVFGVGNLLDDGSSHPTAKL